MVNSFKTTKKDVAAVLARVDKEKDGWSLTSNNWISIQEHDLLNFVNFWETLWRLLQTCEFMVCWEGFQSFWLLMYQW